MMKNMWSLLGLVLCFAMGSAYPMQPELTRKLMNLKQSLSTLKERLEQLSTKLKRLKGKLGGESEELSQAVYLARAKAEQAWANLRPLQGELAKRKNGYFVQQVRELNGALKSLVSDPDTTEDAYNEFADQAGELRESAQAWIASQESHEVVAQVQQPQPTEEEIAGARAYAQQALEKLLDLKAQLDSQNEEDKKWIFTIDGYAKSFNPASTNPDYYKTFAKVSSQSSTSVDDVEKNVQEYLQLKSKPVLTKAEQAHQEMALLNSIKVMLTEEKNRALLSQIDDHDRWLKRLLADPDATDGEYDKFLGSVHELQRSSHEEVMQAVEHVEELEQARSKAQEAMVTLNDVKVMLDEEENGLAIGQIDSHDSWLKSLAARPDATEDDYNDFLNSAHELQQSLDNKPVNKNLTNARKEARDAMNQLEELRLNLNPEQDQVLIGQIERIGQEFKTLAGRTMIIDECNQFADKAAELYDEIMEKKFGA